MMNYSRREPIEFWTVLGGQDPYAHNKIPKERLFTMETGPDGSIEAVEVFDFEQSNLSDRRVAILDAGDVVYIWVGSRSKRADKADMRAMCGYFCNRESIRTSYNSHNIGQMSKSQIIGV